MTEARQDVVLLVDADAAARTVLLAALQREQLRAEACDASASVAMLDQLRPDLLLLDLKEASGDALALLDQLRRRRSSAQVPVLALAAQDDIATMRQAYDLGASDVIAKPVAIELLAPRVRYLIRAARAFQNVARSEANMVLAQRFAQLGSWEWDLQARASYWSEQLYAILGVPIGGVPASLDSYLSFVHAGERDATRSVFRNAMRHGGAAELEHHILRADGEQRVVHLRIDTRSDQGRTTFMYGTLQDVTQRRQNELKIQELAYYDSLTGLPNRRLFVDQLSRAIALAERNERILVTMFLDVDDLKRINDTLGHDAGDAMLREVARRLTECLRASDVVFRDIAATDDETRGVVAREEPRARHTVARIGGDEFTILLPEVVQPDDAAVVARRVLSALSKPMMLVGQELMISASLGVAVYPDDAVNADDLLKAADTAMYHAKESAKGSFKFFTQPMNVIALKRLVMENELRRGLQRKEFELYYLPHVDATRNKIVAVEALLRWNHPERGVLPASEFLPTAENSGLFIAMGAWVLEQACRQAALWRDAWLPVLPVTVNVSASSFRDKGFTALLRQALQAAQLDSSHLVLELTENSLMHDTKEARASLEELKALGVRLQIDDFGVGFSSLNRIKSLPIDAIKIDASFVRNVERDPVIATTIISLARCLGLGVVAEGVETQAQREALLRLGCYTTQGHYYGEAMPASAFEALVRERYLPMKAAVS